MELFDRRSAPKRADTWFVYFLVDSRDTSSVRYVGVTNNPRSRLTLHLSQAPKEGWKKSRWIGSVVAGGGDILLGIIESGLSQMDALHREIEVISEYRTNGADLMNLTDGGDGAVGQVQSAETCAKKSAALSGRQRSSEHAERISAALRGRKFTSEQRQRMSDAHLARYQNDSGQAERQRQNNIKRFSDRAERKKISDAVRSRYANPNVRAAHSATMVAVRDRDPTIFERQLATKRLLGPQSNGKSGFKGVTFLAERGRYRASIRIDGKTRFLGSFPTAELAAEAYDAAALSAWGDGCFLNFNSANRAA